MKKHLTTGILILCLFIESLSFAQNNADASWTMLFDGENLENWDTYLGPEIRPDIPREKLREQPVHGLNNDPRNVFSIVTLEGEPVLRISGEIWGGISTRQEFENFHLQLKFKWGKMKWYPRDATEEKRDSGLLYHGVGEQGAGDGFWLQSQEFQIQEGDCGDYWGVAGAVSDVKAKKKEDGLYYYDVNGPLLTFSAENEIGRNCKKFPDAEKASGEWNTIDLYCLGGSSVHMVNGVVTMVLRNSRRIEGHGFTPLEKGKVQLQSESAEVFYKDIRIRPIDRLPEF
jgi:hypothetical protein